MLGPVVLEARAPRAEDVELLVAQHPFDRIDRQVDVEVLADRGGRPEEGQAGQR